MKYGVIKWFPALAAVGVFLIAGGCGDDDDSTPEFVPGECTPGSTMACNCDNGGSGERTCNAEGTGYGECVCGSDLPDGSTAGSGGSGGTGGGGTGGTGGDVVTGGTGAEGGVGGASGSGTGGGPPIAPSGKCADPPPPGAQMPPPVPPYSGGTCPTLTTGIDAPSTMQSGGETRTFLVIVPEDLDPSESMPTVFLWHWLGGKAASFYTKGDVQNAVNRERMIAVIPESIGAGLFGLFKWPWSTDAAGLVDRELRFFDDMLACVSQQFNVNLNCVATAGVSDGALWSAQLAQGWARGNYLSSAVILSGAVSDPSGITRPWTESGHRMPAVVLWGGPTDSCIVVKFEPGSQALEQALVANGHFIVECIHNCGHGEPPNIQSSAQVIWSFLKDHPYWLADGDSPYLTEGLPAGMPEWCAIGAGNAIPRSDPAGCGEPGCPFK